MANLLSTQNLVEAPFIIMHVGEYQFGSYTESIQKTRTLTEYKRIYPNFMDKITIKKTNGIVGEYNVQLIYQISKGDDPDFLEKVFSTVSETRRVKFSYGDWASPSFIYREESALITNIKSSVNFSGSSITYTLTCVSDSLNLTVNAYNFSKRRAQPSSVIRYLLNTPYYGLTKIFYGMANINDAQLNNLLIGDDAVVDIEAKMQSTVIEYLNYLVSCMRPNSDANQDNLISKSAYALVVEDNSFNEFNGPFFKIVKVNSNTSNINNSLETYDLDIGFPTNNYVTNFSIDDTEQWSILYKFNGKLNQSEYIQRIDNKGNIENIYSPNISTNNPLMKATSDVKTWWTKMTQFPITATVTLKGLLRPSMLMTYVNLNVYWYGEKSIHSGLYIITSHIDTVDKTGYRTELKLLRVNTNG